MSGSVDDKTLYHPYGVATDGTKLFIADSDNGRILIYNEIPTENNASADVVIGQPDMVTEFDSPEEATQDNFGWPTTVITDDTRLYVSDVAFNRILIFNTIPTANGALPDVVIGQQDLASNGINQGGNVGANTLYFDWYFASLAVSQDKLFVPDAFNHRVLIYPLGPQNTSFTTSQESSQKEVTLGLSASGDAKEYIVSENPDFAGASWQSYTTSPSYTLKDDAYEHTIYTKFRDHANYESAALSQTVRYNKPATGGGMPAGAMNPPSPASQSTGFSVVINDNQANTTNREVTLKFNTGSDTARVAVSEDPNFTNAPLLDYQPEMAYTLSAGNGPKTVYVKFYTQYGYASKAVSDMITLGETVASTPTEPQAPVASPSSLDRLIKYPDSPTVYWLNPNNEKQPFYNALAFTDRDFDWSAIETVNPAETWPTGPMLYPNNYTEPSATVWTPPAGYEHIVSPSQFGNYSQIITEPNSPRKYGLPKQTANQPTNYHHGFTFTEYLSLGYKSPEVRNLQRVLKDLGYYSYHTATGYFGSLTESAVKKFQASRNIPLTGTVGPKTREELNKMR